MNIDLLIPFCAPAELNKPNLENPFSFGEWTYFTDQAVIVRVHRIGHVPENAKAPARKCEGLFESVFAGEELTLPTEVPESTARRDGAVAINLGGDLWLNAVYVRLLKTLPALKVYRTGDYEPLRFTFEGGSGLLMPFINRTI
jgi:hypothetical protein